MIVTPKIIEWWVAVFALMRIGAVAIPGTSLLVGSGRSFSSFSRYCDKDMNTIN